MIRSTTRNSSSFAEEKLYINVLNGMFSGALANALANPTDLLKVRAMNAL